MNDLFGITTCVCAMCGKEFERLSPDWTYKITIQGKTAYYHNYSCWSKALDDKGLKDRARKKMVRLSDDQKKLLNELLDRGVDQTTIAKKLNVSKQVVAYYRKIRP